MRILRIKRMLAVVAASAGLLFPSLAGPVMVGAQGTSDSSGGSGIQIVPTRTELTANPGELKDLTLTLKNVTQGPIVAQGYLHDFEPNNITGEPKIIVDPSFSTPYSLKPFIASLQDYELAPGEVKDITIPMSIPNEAAPGGYYGAIRYAAVPKDKINSEEDRQVALTASVASLVLVEVSGDITESVTVQKVAVSLDGKAGGLFVKGPNSASVEISNNGNSFVKPFGIVTVKRGGKEVFNYQINNVGARGNILPSSSRTFTDEIKNTSSFGKYVVTANVSYTDGGEVITATKTFWVIPVWMVALALAIFALIVAGVVYIKVRLGGRRPLKRS